MARYGSQKMQNWIDLKLEIYDFNISTFHLHLLLQKHSLFACHRLKNRLLETTISISPKRVVYKQKTVRGYV